MSDIELGIQVLVLGICTVAFILGLLILLTLALEKFSRVKSKTFVPELSAPAVQSDSDDDEIMAVITATIYGILSSEQNVKSNLNFRVRNIRRI